MTRAFVRQVGITPAVIERPSPDLGRSRAISFKTSNHAICRAQDFRWLQMT